MRPTIKWWWWWWWWGGGGSHMGTFARPWGGGIERHRCGVNPHSPRPSPSRAGHNKPRPPPPGSPRWPLTPRLQPLSPGPLCLHSVIICNIYSFWFPRGPLSSPTQLLWLTAELKCSPSYASSTPRNLKAHSKHHLKWEPVAHNHLFMASWFKEGHRRAAVSKWTKSNKCWQRSERVAPGYHGTAGSLLDSSCGTLLHILFLSALMFPDTNP